MRWRGLGLKSSIMGPSQWNYLDFRCDSDFFTLDPNLATALRLTTTPGVFRRRLGPPRTWKTTRKERTKWRDRGRMSQFRSLAIALAVAPLLLPLPLPSTAKAASDRAS